MEDFLLVNRMASFFENDSGQWQLQGLTIASVSFGMYTSLSISVALLKYPTQSFQLQIGPHTYDYSWQTRTQLNVAVSPIAKCRMNSLLFH